jgi:hypothetical protein
MTLWPLFPTTRYRCFPRDKALWLTSMCTDSTLLEPAVSRPVIVRELQLKHFIGGPCYPSHPTCLALLRSVRSQRSIRGMNVDVVGKQGVWPAMVATY